MLRSAYRAGAGSAPTMSFMAAARTGAFWRNPYAGAVLELLKVKKLSALENFAKTAGKINHFEEPDKFNVQSASDLADELDFEHPLLYGIAGVV